MADAGLLRHCFQAEPAVAFSACSTFLQVALVLRRSAMLPECQEAAAGCEAHVHWRM